MISRKSFVVITFTVVTLLIGYTLHAANQTELLEQYMANLKKNPKDIALRADIIRLSLSMKPAPPVTDEVKQLISQGETVLKKATSQDEYLTAVRTFEKAALIAPWYAKAYYDLGIAQDKAGMGYDAIKNLKLYTLASPDKQDYETIKDLAKRIATKANNKDH